MSVSPIPANCNTVNVYLILKDARGALDFYAKAFGGTAVACMDAPDGSLMHGEITIGNSTIMVSEENLDWNMKSVESFGGSPISIHLYVDDCDALFKQAVDAGCSQIQPVTDMFWGDRYGKVADPYGYQWGIATHIEDVEPEEMARRGQEWFAQMASGESGGAN